MVLVGVDFCFNDFVLCISVMYWLDGGYNGELNMWIIDEKFFDYLVKYVLRICVYVIFY